MVVAIDDGTDYYWKIIEWLDNKGYDTSLALTTNLWLSIKNFIVVGLTYLITIE